MKKMIISGALAFLLVAGYSCKDKKGGGDKTTNTTTTTTNSTDPTTTNNSSGRPVQVTEDETLQKGVADATKDIKGLKARVENGIIYLSGTISKEDNRRITPTLNSLRPKNINRDSLTVK